MIYHTSPFHRQVTMAKRGFEALVAAAKMGVNDNEPAPKRSIRETITIKLDVYKDQFSASDLLWIEKGDVDRHTRILEAAIDCARADETDTREIVRLRADMEEMKRTQSVALARVSGVICPDKGLAGEAYVEGMISRIPGVQVSTVSKRKKSCDVMVIYQGVKIRVEVKNVSTWNNEVSPPMRIGCR